LTALRNAKAACTLHDIAVLVSEVALGALLKMRLLPWTVPWPVT